MLTSRGLRRAEGRQVQDRKVVSQVVDFDFVYAKRTREEEKEAKELRLNSRSREERREHHEAVNETRRREVCRLIHRDRPGEVVDPGERAGCVRASWCSR